MKKSISRVTKLVALLCAFLMVAACGNQQTGGGTSDPSGAKTYRVAYIARAQVDSFAAWLANEIKAEAANYDDISLDVFDGQANDEKVNTMIENAIANKYDAIIIQPNNGDAQTPYIEQAVNAGIVTITTNPRVEIDGASSIDANPYDQGAVVAKRALEDIPQGANVVVLNGPAGNMHSTERRKAWETEFFAKRADVKILDEQIANWNKDEAMRFMEDWITAHGDIDAIISMNDNMAAGAIEAAGDKAGTILAYGVDGTPEACLLIQEGKMVASTLQSAGDLAKLNIKAAHDLLTGKETSVRADIDTPVIDKTNVDEYVQMYKDAGLIK